MWNCSAGAKLRCLPGAVPFWTVDNVIMYYNHSFLSKEFIILVILSYVSLSWEFSRETGQEATVETFASALFGPSGKAKDEGQQVWQRETLFEAAIQSR